MPCYSLLDAWRSKVVNPDTGKRGITFDRSKAFVDMPLKLPCGQCIGCRLERSRQWAMRCLHESELHDENCFLTLTLAKVPLNGSLDKREFQLFMKRLRKAFPGRVIRYFHCGEYGEKLQRPHYHACVFGFDFDDKVFAKLSADGKSRLYTSETLDKIWGLGNCWIGDVTFESAAYVARYIMKKVNNDVTQVDCKGNIHLSKEEHYAGRYPEYVTMSRRPGIGRGWYDRFKSDIFPGDFAVVRGVKVRPPKFYDGLYEVSDPEMFRVIKGKRRRNGELVAPDNTWERLRVKEFVKKSRIALLRRPLEADNGA